jgi:hypothetical protein
MNRVHSDPVTTAGAIEVMVIALRIANRSVVSLIECNCTRADTPGDLRAWWDVEPLTNRHEQPAEVLDMNTEELRFARTCHLIEDHPTLPHTVRIVHRPS